MKLDLELLRASVSGMMMYCKDADMKKSLKKHANTIDLMIEGQELPIHSVSNQRELLKAYEQANNPCDCDSCKETANERIEKYLSL